MRLAEVLAVVRRMLVAAQAEADAGREAEAWLLNFWAGEVRKAVQP